VAPSGELRGNGRCGVLCSVTTVWSIPERFRGEFTMKRYTNSHLYLFKTGVSDWPWGTSLPRSDDESRRGRRQTSSWRWGVRGPSRRRRSSPTALRRHLSRSQTAERYTADPKSPGCGPPVTCGCPGLSSPSTALARSAVVLSLLCHRLPLTHHTHHGLNITSLQMK